MPKDDKAFWQSVALTFALLSAANAAFAGTIHNVTLLVINVVLTISNVVLFELFKRK